MIGQFKGRVVDGQWCYLPERMLLAGCQTTANGGEETVSDSLSKGCMMELTNDMFGHAPEVGDKFKGWPQLVAADW